MNQQKKGNPVYKATQRFCEELFSCQRFNNTNVTWDKLLDILIDKRNCGHNYSPLPVHKMHEIAETLSENIIVMSNELDIDDLLSQ